MSYSGLYKIIHRWLLRPEIVEVKDPVIHHNYEITSYSYAKSCFRDKYGGTLVHIAAREGRVDTLKELLGASPASVKEVNATGKTCLHTAVIYNKGKVVHYLVKWLGKRSIDYVNLVNVRDQAGNTVLHLATSRKQLQTLKVLLTSDPNISNSVEVNALNSRGFTALDILDVLPYGGKIDMEIDKILRRAGALNARDLLVCGRKHDDVYDCRMGTHQPWHKTVMTISKSRKDYARIVLLMTATLVATITFQAVLSHPVGTLKQGYTYNYDPNGTLQMKKQDSILAGSFILFNTIGFVASLSIIIFLLYEFPLKPWPQISISTLFGSYACVITEISAGEALPLLALSIPVLLFAARGKLHVFARQGSY